MNARGPARVRLSGFPFPTSPRSGTRLFRIALFRRSFVSGAVLALSSLASVVAAQPSSKLAVATRTDRAPRIDGRLDDAVWARARVIEGFTQSRPLPGAAATERTLVYIVYDDEALYVGARLLRARPSDIAKTMTRRDGFGNDWSYDPTTGCNTRERVLIDESLTPAVVNDRCHPSSGRWVSAYDGVTTNDPTDLQIDHFIPLANAWRSGAATWTPERRLAFANDLTSPLTLVAVTGSSNGSKSDSSPDQWLPPDHDAWCTYATNWVSVKHRWALTVTVPEKAALVKILNGC